MIVRLLSAALALAAAPAVAGGLLLSDVFVRAVPEGAMASAAYMTIANTGETADRLIDARAAVARRVEIHTHVIEDGVAKMRRIDGVEIAPGETATLEPGGLHVMLMGLVGPLDDGDAVALTLVFEQAGERTVDAPVIALRPRAAAHGHAGH